MKELMEPFYSEELEDEAKYMEMADEIEKEHPHAAGILRDIAKEEHSHARMIKHILEM